MKTRYRIPEDEQMEAAQSGVLIDSENIDFSWRRVYAPGYNPAKDPKYSPKAKGDAMTGKWLIFINNTKDQFLEHWSKVKESTLEGKLGIASKVTNPDIPRDSLVMCVYTKDYSDVEDVTRVREALRSLGYTGTLPYKPDFETLRGRYGSDTVMYRA